MFLAGIIPAPHEPPNRALNHYATPHRRRISRVLGPWRQILANRSSLAMSPYPGRFSRCDMAANIFLTFATFVVRGVAGMTLAVNCGNGDLDRPTLPTPLPSFTYS